MNWTCWNVAAEVKTANSLFLRFALKPQDDATAEQFKQHPWKAQATVLHEEDKTPRGISVACSSIKEHLKGYKYVYIFGI